jgi:hypothetical protein
MTNSNEYTDKELEIMNAFGADDETEATNDPTIRPELVRLLGYDVTTGDLDTSTALDLLQEYDQAIINHSTLMLESFQAYCDTDFSTADLLTSVEIVNGSSEHA